MNNPKPVSDVRTVNAGCYHSPNAHVGIARCNGLPIAFRRVCVVGQPGSFATTRFQAITAARITPLASSKIRRLARQLHPLN